jgi:hypothetical protein
MLHITDLRTQLPLTNPYPGRRSILVLDNARVHHAADIEELVHSYGTRFLLVLLFSADQGI